MNLEQSRAEDRKRHWKAAGSPKIVNGEYEAKCCVKVSCPVSLEPQDQGPVCKREHCGGLIKIMSFPAPKRTK